MKPLSIIGEFKKIVLPHLPNFGFVEYSAKKFGALSQDGILISIFLFVRTVDIRRFSIEMGACDIHQAHDALPLTVGGKFPDFHNGDDYNARDPEILARSLAYVVQHLERGPRAWMNRVFDLPGYMAELRSLENVRPYLWRTGHIQFSLGIGALRGGGAAEATTLFRQARECFMATCCENPFAPWAKEAVESCDTYIALANGGTREEINARFERNRNLTIEALRLGKLTHRS